MNKNLIIEIPIRFKKELEKRFNFESRIVEGEKSIIKIPCPLCKIYYDEENEVCDNDCPFARYDGKGGCRTWIEDVMGKVPVGLYLGFHRISWWDEDDEIVRGWLEKLRKEAEKYIKWVEEK